MIKLHYQDAQEELVRAAGQLTTLIESDRHIKSASSDVMSREMLASCRPDKDHALIHLIAMGAGEHYGFNRNGDFFGKAACEKYHPTFVTNGAMFREHRNRDAKTQGIGTVKASAYNKEQGRVELAVWANRKKAEDVIEKIASGQPTSYSMSCRVPEDVSSITGKRCKSPAEYDDYCKYRMGQYIPEFKKYAYVDNPKPTFFDISYVKNPADRIAHYLEYQMDKAASASVLNGVDLATLEGVSIPEFGLGCVDGFKAATLVKLSELETYLDAVEAGTAGNDGRTQFCKHAGANAFRGELTEAQLIGFRAIDPGTLFHKLARRQVILPFASFVSYATNSTLRDTSDLPAVKLASVQLGSLFRKLASCAPCEFEEMFEPSSSFMTSADLRCSDSIDKLLDEAGEKFSHSPGAVGRRSLEITINGQRGEKSAANKSFQNEADILLSMYGHYKLAAIKAIRNFHGDDTVDTVSLLSVIHNRTT